MPEPLRVLSIGLGWVATNRHLPVMTASPEFDVVGVADRRPDRVEEVARKFKVDRFYSAPGLAEEDGLGQIPWLDEVEAVVIGASPFAHFTLAKAALRAGKHVLTEKPFAMTVEEGEELVALARESGRTLAVVHNFQFAPSTRRLLADISSGKIGRIRSVSGVVFGNPRRRLPEWYEELPLGLFYDESPHLYYLLRSVLPNPMTPIQCDLFPGSDGKATPAQLSQWFTSSTEEGTTIPVHLSMNFESPLSEWHLQVHGENAFADVDIFRDIYLCLPNDGAHTAATILRTSLQTSLQHWMQHLPCGLKHFRGRMWYGNEEVFHRFADAIRRKQQPEGISGEDALAILKLQHHAIETSRTLAQGWKRLMEPEAEGGLHVLLVTHYFAEQGGGIERVAAQLATHLVRTGHRVTWAASDTCPLTESPRAATQCVPMRAWDGIQRATGAPWPIWSPSSIRRLWSHVGKASVVHLHDCLYMGNAFAYLFARLRGRPVVVTQHVSDVPFKSPLLKIALWLAYQSVGRLILGHADQVVFISEVVRNDFQSRFRFHNEPRFVPNGVDSSLFVPLDGERREKLRGELLGTFGAKTVFMFAGRFVEKKGLSALRRIAASMPDRFFVLVGQGPIDPRTWGLENVQVVGAVAQSELARYYQAADALVLPSVGEGLPLVVQEAMSAGLPAAVSSRTARADSTVSACLLHAPCTDELDEDAVVDRWIALLDSFDRETSSSEARRNEIRQVATSRWAWERCAEQYAEIFRALCR